MNLQAPIRLGDFEIYRVVEMAMPFLPIDVMFPAATEPEIEALLPRLQPWCLDAERQVLISVHAYVVRTPRHVILLDTCIGCDKTNSRFSFWEGRQDRGWLDRLSALVAPEAVTHVLCSHLHADHAGWNTRMIDGRWVPTFPNATYILARDEVAHAEANEPEIFADSVLPVIEAGQATLVETDHQIEDGIWLDPTPGHTPGHVAVHLESRGERAVMWGDLVHSPAQCHHPRWSYRRDFAPSLSVASRQRVLSTAAEHHHLILSSHFPAPSVGHVLVDGDGAFRFDLLGGVA